MSILSIKQEMLLPKREVIINKSFFMRQKPVLIASLTEQDGIVKLWIFQQLPDSPFTNIDEPELLECVTNRDEIWRRTSNKRISCGHISAISLQGVDLPISQSTYGVVGHDPTKYMKIQHFIEAGVDFSPMEDISFSELVLGEYQMTEETTFPEFEIGADMPVSLSLREEACEILVEPTHWFKLKTGEHDITNSFLDPSDGKEITYYIDRIICHDVWREMEERLQDEETIRIWREQGIDDATIEQMRASLPESIERICPKGHELLIIQYECPEGIQLNFYTTEFLLERPERSGSSTVVAMIGSSDEESRHGYRVRSCLLKTVPAGFDGDVEAELISWFKNIPDEKVEA